MSVATAELSQPATKIWTMDLATTSGSAVHHAFAVLDRLVFTGSFVSTKIYAVSVALTFVPLFALALCAPFSVVTPSPGHPLPFLRDLNILFMFLVSFPCLMILTINDQNILVQSLRAVQSDGTVTISERDRRSLNERWRKRFRIVNISGQLLGVAVGATIACVNYIAYSPAGVGFWIAQDGRLLPVGVVFLLCIFLFYALVPIYVLRSIAISLFLRDVVAHSELHMLPLHPDRSGGLRPVGEIGLRNQYGLTLIGFNVVLLIAVSHHYLTVPLPLEFLVAAAVAAYLCLGPVVFMAPLLPFRGGMLKNKRQLLGEVAQRIRRELDRLRLQLPSGSISKDDEELVEGCARLAR